MTIDQEIIDVMRGLELPSDSSHGNVYGLISEKTLKIDGRKVWGYSVIAYSFNGNWVMLSRPIPEGNGDFPVCFYVQISPDGLEKFYLLDIDPGNGKVRITKGGKSLYEKGQNTPESIQPLVDQMILPLSSAESVDNDSIFYDHLTSGLESSSLTR